MEARNPTNQAPPVASTGMDHSDEMIAELDEPPDELHWSPTKLHFGYLKAHPAMNRRESLLTRQLHSETEHTDDEHPGRTMSTQSTWSTQSATSTTELTSDDGRSVPSPAISPPLPPTHNTTALPVHDKPLDQRVKIIGQEDVTASNKDSGSEKTVEANLGRKRCISFACRGKQEAKPVSPPTSQPIQEVSASPPKRKCMLKFVCPTKTGAESKPAEKAASAKRAVSPPPPLRRSSSKPKHRGSDSTVTHVSPKAVRKPGVAASTTPMPVPMEQISAVRNRRYSIDSDQENKEATRFHEFGADEPEAEDWVQESTCHRSRLTVDDTLKKENIIRKTCEEAAEEVLEEDGDDDDDDDLDDDLAEVDRDDGDEVEDESDDGFHSDDEGGFASSDSDRDDDSDFEWWRPGGASTAATSVEHLDRLAIINSQQIEPGSSVNSGNSDVISPRSSRTNLRTTSSRTKRSSAIAIDTRRGSVDLPDSTDFVCGTLDEDRPIEQAYINRKKAKDAARRPSRPQDIDPTFPTSDPDMDEEDDDDVDEVPESDDDDDLMHGALDEIDEPSVKALSPPLRRSKTNTHRSPPPPTRVHTPPPKRTMARSPPPPKRARSPAPRKLFGHSPPLRTKSPVPTKRTTSPPNSPANAPSSPLSTRHGLGTARPQITHTASLPRNGPFAQSKTPYWPSSAYADENSEGSAATEVPRRGAIDIVKGVEFKRQRRREKLHQKLCAKAAAKGEKVHKVKPGRGAERMREVGLQLQEYRGKAEHILSL